MDKVLAFRLWGDYGHFKKYYTTTSPLTFEFPPPPTVLGIISAIIGLDKNDYLNHFQKEKEFNLSIIIEKPITKVRWSQNLIDTSQHFFAIKNRTQIRIEYLKNAAYIIFFSHEKKELYDQLKSNLSEHKSKYTVSLGLSELLANFEYLGEISVTAQKSEQWQWIDSVIPYSQLLDEESIRFNENREIFKVNYPIFMRPDRVINKREDVLFERNGLSIECRIKDAWKTERGDRIVFF